MLSHLLAPAINRQVRTLSYVSKTRLIQQLKEDAGFCREQLSAGEFLVYAKARENNPKKRISQQHPLLFGALIISLNAPE